MNAVRTSIVVCTYNRSSVLLDCLARLAPQSGPITRSEVLIVDNNSTDDTAEVAKPFCARHPWFRLLVETSQGLAPARNRGWREATGEYVAFIDDDARPSDNWAQAIGQFADAHPDAAAFGGPFRAFAPTSKPDWFPTEYGSWDLGSTPRCLTTREFLNGTNMVFRRSVLQSMGGFDEALGMRGAQIAYGEETELMMRMHAQGMRIYYTPDIVVDHAILEYKLSLRWLLKSAYRNGRSGLRFEGERQDDTWLSYSISLMRGAARALYELPKTGEPHAKTAIYRAFAPFMWKMGYFVSLLRRPGCPPHGNSLGKKRG